MKKIYILNLERKDLVGEKWKNKREMLFCEGARVYVAVGSVWNHVAGDGRVSAFCFCPASGGISFFRSVVMFLLFRR